MTSDVSLELLSELFRQVRQHTIHIFEQADIRSLRFAPNGTSNHMLWHAGHAIWLQDVLCLQLLGHTSELADGWNETFGMNCHPVSQTTDWPTHAHMLKLLQDQCQRITDVLQNANNADLLRVANPERGPLTVASRIIHGFHDEAKHSGEMYLLHKLFVAKQQAVME